MKIAGAIRDAEEDDAIIDMNLSQLHKNFDMQERLRAGLLESSKFSRV